MFFVLYTLTVYELWLVCTVVKQLNLITLLNAWPNSNLPTRIVLFSGLLWKLLFFFHHLSLFQVSCVPRSHTISFTAPLFMAAIGGEFTATRSPYSALPLSLSLSLILSCLCSSVDMWPGTS